MATVMCVVSFPVSRMGCSVCSCTALDERSTTVEVTVCLENEENCRMFWLLDLQIAVHVDAIFMCVKNKPSICGPAV